MVIEGAGEREEMVRRVTAGVEAPTDGEGRQRDVMVTETRMRLVDEERHVTEDCVTAMEITERGAVQAG